MSLAGYVHPIGTGLPGNMADACASSPQEHNQRINQALDHLANNLPTFAIFDRGRNPDETSYIWVENGSFYRMGYIYHDSDIFSPEDIKETLTRYANNHYMMQLIYDYAEKHPAKIWRSEQTTIPITKTI